MSTLKADTLVASDGTSPVTLTKQHAAKAWVYFDTLVDSSSPVARGSFNVSSLINETTEDGMFTLKEVECLGACVNAPMIQINDDYFEDLDKDSLIKLLEDLKNGNKVKVGSQIKERNGAEPIKNIGKS